MQLAREDIIARCSHVIFERGLRYYRENRVKSVKYNDKKNSFRGIVVGEKPYTQEVAFTQNGDIRDTFCTCLAFGQPGDCKHIVALLLALRQLEYQGIFDQYREKQRVRAFLDGLETLEQIRTVSLFPLLEWPVHSAPTHPRIFLKDQQCARLSLRIGTDYPYIIRDIRKFTQLVSQNQPVPFGKRFTFDPLMDHLSEPDARLLRFLCGISDAIETGSISAHHSFGAENIFRERHITLSPTLLKQALSLLEGRQFNFAYHQQPQRQLTISHDALPIDVTLLADTEEWVLSLSQNELEPLTPLWEYAAWQGDLYCLSENQARSLRFLWQTTEPDGTDTDHRVLRFSGEDKELLLSRLTALSYKLPVRLDEKLQARFWQPPLMPQLYLQRYGEGIGVDVRFAYDEALVSGERVTGVPEGRVLRRDNEGEKAVWEGLKALGFQHSPTGVPSMVIENPDAVFDFLENAVEQMLSLGTVYYTDDWKTIAARRSVSWKGGVRLGGDLLEINFAVDGIDRKTLPELLAALKEKRRYYRLKDGSFLSLQAPEAESLSNWVQALDVGRKHIGPGGVVSMEVARNRAFYLKALMEKGRVNGEGSALQADESFEEYLRGMEETPAPPDALAGILRPYQLTGFQWLKSLSKMGLGGILADDMGLGKTLQMIALFLSDKEKLGAAPSLVIAPTSLLYNWQAEVQKFAPTLSTCIITGSAPERAELLNTMQQHPADVMITSYPLIRRDGELYKPFRFRYCILDEAQHIKNPGSHSAQEVKNIHADCRFAMTGTPMENALTEMWSIFDFVLPGYLYNHSRFVSQYETPITRHQDREALEDVSRHIRPFILRRLKSDVLKELPEKIITSVMAEMEHEQKKVYLAYRDKLRQELHREVSQQGFDKSRMKILAGLTRLRQICCHPALFLEDYRGESAKLQMLEEVLADALAAGHRVLLFSQFTAMLAIIKKRLETHHISYAYLDGGTKVPDRQQLVDDFNKGQGDVFLISLKAGGTGLNLTGADTVIHYDPWWNPAVEDQATDRAYRIGQTNRVQVMKLIMGGTIEERIDELQKKKKALTDAVIQPGESMLQHMTWEDLEGLFA